MAPPDWLHCNKCSILYKENLKFFMSGCGHVVCENCANITGSRRCAVCETPTSIMHLSKDLSRDILEYFEPMHIPLEKANKIVKFQTKNMGMILRNTLSKYSFAKDSLVKAAKAIDYLKAENAKLKSMLMKREGSNFSNCLPEVKMHRGPSRQSNSSIPSHNSHGNNMFYNKYDDPRMEYKTNPMKRSNVVPTHNPNSTLGSISLGRMSIGNFRREYGTSSISN